MSTTRTSIRAWLTAVVVSHLVISFVHGNAHSGAHVELSLLGTLFVFVIILAGPLVGLALTWVSLRTGGWVVASTMAAAFVFGVVNHFLLTSPDHVTQVASEWRLLFSVTAVLLALTEALGSWLALQLVRERQQRQVLV
jgi:hypothetical protein